MKAAFVVTCVSAAFGISLLVSGVYLLAGIGWALVASSVPALLLSAVAIRGLSRVE